MNETARQQNMMMPVMLGIVVIVLVVAVLILATTGRGGTIEQNTSNDTQAPVGVTQVAPSGQSPNGPTINVTVAPNLPSINVTVAPQGAGAPTP